MSDILLDQGEQVTVLCDNLNVQGHTLCLIYLAGEVSMDHDSAGTRALSKRWSRHQFRQ